MYQPGTSDRADCDRADCDRADCDRAGWAEPFYVGVYVGVTSAAVAFVHGAGCGGAGAPGALMGPAARVEVLALPAPERSTHLRVLRALRSVDECAARIAAFCSCRQPELIAIPGYAHSDRLHLIRTVELGMLLRSEFGQRGWPLCEVPRPFLPAFMGGESGARGSALALARIARACRHPELLTGRQRRAIELLLCQEAPHASTPG